MVKLFTKIITQQKNHHNNKYNFLGNSTKTSGNQIFLDTEKHKVTDYNSKIETIRLSSVILLLLVQV